MRIIHLLVVVLLVAIVLPATARAADGASVRAILITATNLKREADPKLAPYEAELQRNLPLSSFRYIGEGSARLPANGRANISLGRGHRLVLEGEGSGGGGIGVKAQWMNGNSVVMNISVTLAPGVPAVLGRRPSGDAETPIVLLIAR
jgi:hypothetical protein